MALCVEARRIAEAVVPPLLLTIGTAMQPGIVQRVAVAIDRVRLTIAPIVITRGHIALRLALAIT